jgi:F420-dependent oxidoreductase-like protein
VRLHLMIEGQEDVTWEDWVALARSCEAQGIGTIFRSDHYLSVQGHHAHGSLDAWATICALSAVTSQLRFGTLVSPATFRHPSVLAKLAASADHVSGGRIELGMGTGWLESEHVAYGFPFPPMPERLERLEEQLQIVAGEWSEGPFTFDGRHYRATGVDALPKPVQSPRPPLLLGGMGGPRSIALGARLADEYNTVDRTAAECAAIAAQLERECERAGREPIPLSLMTGWLVGEDRAELLDRAGRLAAWRHHDGDAESFLAGLPASWITGTLEQAAEQLEALETAGVQRVMTQHLLHRDLDALAQIARLSD